MSIQAGPELLILMYIMQTIETKDELHLLLEIPYSENELNNVYSFDKQGNVNWRKNVHFED